MMVSMDCLGLTAKIVKRKICTNAGWCTMLDVILMNLFELNHSHECMVVRTEDNQCGSDHEDDSDDDDADGGDNE